jgi:hypothetical protein
MNRLAAISCVLCFVAGAVLSGLTVSAIFTAKQLAARKVMDNFLPCKELSIFDGFLKGARK